MDLLPCLPSDPNDLLEELNLITHNNPSSLSQTQFFAFLQNILRSQEDPTCRQCFTPLINNQIGFDGLQIYCLHCLHELQLQKQSSSSKFEIITMNLAQPICQEREWTMWDHLQFSFKVGQLLQEKKEVSRQALIQVGQSLYNKKADHQTESYLKLIKSSCLRLPMCSPFTELSQLLLLNELDLEIDLSDIELNMEDLQHASLFQRLSSQQDDLSRTIQIKTMKLQNQSEKQFLNKMTAQDSRTNFIILQKTMKIHSSSIATEPLKPSEVSKTEITEESTNHNIKVKSMSFDIDESFKKIQQQFMELKKRQPKKKKIIRKSC